MGQMHHIRKQLFRLTQAEMAALAGVSQATVSRWENGELEPGRDDLAKIRQEAIRRGLQWDDALFFDAAPSSNEAAA